MHGGVVTLLAVLARHSSLYITRARALLLPRACPSSRACHHHAYGRPAIKRGAAPSDCRAAVGYHTIMLARGRWPTDGWTQSEDEDTR